MRIGNQKTILLVEDEAVIAMAEKATLEEHGFKVVTALTGEKALDIAGATPDIDLVLMDIDLGRGVDGTETATRILEKRDLPLIFLSSHTEPAVVEKTEGITSYGYIVKNSGETVLMASIKMAFRLFESRMQERQNREALKESEERFAHLFERAPLGYQSLDENGFFVEVNEAWLETLGYRRDEVIGKWFGDFLAPDFVPCFRENFVKFKKAGRIHSEFEMLHKSGQRKYIAFDGRIGRKPDGSFEQTHCILQDVTEKKRAEEEIKNRELLLNKIFDVLPIGLWFADKEGTLLRGNPAGIKIWGAEPKVSPADYGVFKARRLPSGEELAPGDWALARTIREGVTVEDELLEIDAFDGKKKVILNYTAPVIDDNGCLLGAIIVNNDITDRKTGETALQEKENNFRTLAENAGVGITVIQDNGIRYINSTAAEISGYSKDEMSTLRMEDLLKRIHPEDRPIIAEKYGEQHRNLRTYAEKGKVFAPIGYRHIRMDGSVIWTEAISSAIYYDGEPALLIIHNDVSGRKRLPGKFGESPASGQSTDPAL